ncbi:Ribonuclease H-like superfamily [Sesbania bispinosa]|nr:Ribonuclease H-like superfamily [Sesbania bispinosa]
MIPTPWLNLLGNGFGVVQLWKVSVSCCGWSVMIPYPPTVFLATVACQLMSRGLGDLCAEDNIASIRDWLIKGIEIAGSLFLTGHVAVPKPVRMVCWEPPNQHQFALNTDGSVSDTTAGFGGIIRTQDGSWLGGYYGSLKDVDILGAELIAILEGLHICWNRNLRNIKAHE